jgi:glycogen debranching enzyme
MRKNVASQAVAIAKQNLRACYQTHGIIAGPHHFTDYWARDAFFASLGSLAIGDTEIVSKMVDLFFTHQRDDGLIPYRIMRGPISLSKYQGHPKFYKQLRPTYKLRGFGQAVLDGTTLTVLFTTLLKIPKHENQIQKALTYLETKEKYDLLWDGPMAEWNDAIWKMGNLLYSNIVYWYMYQCLASSTKNNSPTRDKYRQKSDRIAGALRKRLWNGKFFADWNDYKRQDYFAPFGNCLAVVWGLTTDEESKSILEAAAKSIVNFTLETNMPKYPWWRVDLAQRALGMADYQNQSLLWWQPITSYIAALKKVGLNKSAANHIDIISKKIISDGIIHECYERNGNPVKRSLYKSEHPFAWASGMVIWSVQL